MTARIITWIRIAGAVAILVLILAWRLEHKARVKAQNDRDREQENTAQLMASNQQYQHILLTTKEALQIKDLKLDSLAKALKVKPKQIERIQVEIQIQHDTIKVPVQVAPIGKDRWQISDQEKCWSWKGRAELHGDSLVVTREDFTYTNKTTNTFYRMRTRHFLFFRVGPKKSFMKSSSDCGQETMTEITFIKE
jgi:hypothetical protein